MNFFEKVTLSSCHSSQAIFVCWYVSEEVGLYFYYYNKVIRVKRMQIITTSAWKRFSDSILHAINLPHLHNKVWKSEKNYLPQFCI